MSSAIQHGIRHNSTLFGGAWETDCLNTRLGVNLDRNLELEFGNLTYLFQSCIWTVNKLKIYNLASCCIPSGIVRGNEAPKATVSTYLSPCPLSSTSSDIMCFQRSTEVSPFLPLHQKSLLAFFYHSFISCAQTSSSSELVLLHSHRETLDSTCHSLYIFIADSVS